MSELPKSDPPDRARGVFLGDLAHDLSTPLTAIHGATELLLTGAYGPLEGEQRTLVAEILASARDLRSYVQDVADLGALDTGRLVFASTSFNAHAVIDDVQTACAATAAGRAVQFSLDAHAPPVLESDERRLRQVLSAVFGYAVKAARRGSAVTGTVTHRDRVLRVEVRTSGVTPTGDPRALFVDRRDLTPGVPKQYRGPGLGLPLIGRVVEAWGGQVGASVVDGALVLTVDVPAVAVPPA